MKRHLAAAVRALRSVLTAEDGQGIAEYGLMLVLVGTVTVGALILAAGSLQGFLSSAANLLP
jgi:Flp pilus assembly pilin Flp